MMKTKIFLTLSIVSALFFSSCDNFMDSSSFQSGLDEKINYANYSSHTIFVNAEEGRGSFIQGGGLQSLKKTDSFTIEFEVSTSYKFIRWLAVDRNDTSISRDNYISFSDSSATKTTVTLLDDCDNILIRPYCLSYLNVSSFLPEYRENGVEYNSDIEITFSQYMDESAFSYTESEIQSLTQSNVNFLTTKTFEGNEYVYGYEQNNKCYYKNINITSSVSGDIVDYFEAPVIIEGKTLYLSLKKDFYDDLLAEISDSSTNEITVTLGSGIKDIRDMSFPENYSNLTFTYVINSNLIFDSPSVELKFYCNENAGSVSPSGFSLIYTDLSYPISFKPSDSYYFMHWGVFYNLTADEVPDADKIIEIDDKNALETSFVLTTPVSGLLVMPVCAARSTVLLSSPSTDGIDPATPVTVTFSKAMNPDDLRWKYSDIQDNSIKSVLRDSDNKIYGYVTNSDDHIWKNITITSSSGDNLLSYFKYGKYTLNNTKLVIETNPAKTLPSGTVVIVQVNKEIRDEDDIPCGADGTFIKFTYMIQ
ncbi:MAG: hypothetical protein K5873_10310 [Treponema sp.]|nr:hypothetical protein [Treponema sp.]